MRIYIAGPITGVPDYMDRFMDAEVSLYKRFGENTEVFNPARISEQLPPLKHEEYMRLCFEMIQMADVVFFLRGFQKSFGEAQECGYALAKKMKIMYEGE